jgi:hypothetical protein
MRGLFLLVVTTSFASLLGACSGQKFGLEPEHNEFSQKGNYNTEVDVLWVIDNSSSMARHQEQLAQKVPEFLNSLAKTGLDFRIAVTTTDMGNGGARGRFLTIPSNTPAVLTAQTPNLASVLGERFRLGQGGSSLERGREAMKASLSEPLTSGYNSGFLREQSLLVVIFLTNEGDSSPNEDYASFLNQLKPPLPSGEPSWVAHFIGVLPNDSSCPSSEWNDISPGLEYMQLADLSGGIKAQICSADFRQVLTNVHERTIEILSEYFLPRVPKAGSIKVTIGGRLIPEDAVNGWTYHVHDETKRSIRFHGTYQPGPRDTVVVDYDPESIR